MTYKDFMVLAEKLVKLSRPEIKQLLFEKFGSWSEEKTGAYVAHLQEIRAKQIDKELKKMEEDAREKRNEPEFCPLHLESKTIGNLRRRNRFSGLPSWHCPICGDSGYWYWRMCKSLERKGLTPVTTPEMWVANHEMRQKELLQERKEWKEAINHVENL